MYSMNEAGYSMNGPDSALTNSLSHRNMQP